MSSCNTDSASRGWPQGKPQANLNEITSLSPMSQTVSHRLQLPQPSSLPPLDLVPQSFNMEDNNRDIQPEPGLRLVSETFPAHNETAGYSDHHFQLPHSQEHAGGSQYQPPAFGISAPFADIPVPDTAAPHSFQLSHSQECAGTSHWQYQPSASGVSAPSAEILVSGIPVSDTVASHSFQLYLSQEHAGGSQYRHPASIISVPLAAYIHQCSSSQEPAGDSQHQHPVSVELAPNLASHDNSNPHLQEHRTGPIKPVITFIAALLTSISMPPKCQLYHNLLVLRRLSSLHRRVEELAKLALDDAIAVYDAGELTDWKSRREGKSTLSKLKGTLKRLHLNSRGYAQGLVSGGYGLSMDISKDATNIIQSRQDYVLFLLLNYDFLDAFVQWIVENGQLVWFHVSFANSTVICMVEYMLVCQQFRSHVAFDTPDWESQLRNIIALAATICHWGVRRYLANGWFGDEDLYMQESEDYHRDLKDRMTSLTDKVTVPCDSDTSKMVSIILKLYSTSLRSQQVKFIQVARSRSSQTVKQSMEIIETARRTSSTRTCMDHCLYFMLSMIILGFTMMFASLLMIRLITNSWPNGTFKIQKVLQSDGNTILDNNHYNLKDSLVH
ncbi:hypothetical protein BDR06DRAFT_977341 [Suillus hirtellus]|nr:hypothetical protein BDR06DRAFT_977341 [Suillus hirtellus]